MLNQGDILTLNNYKKYTVVYTIVFQSKNYVYLIDQEDYTNTMFCEYDDKDELKEVIDPEMIEQFMMQIKEQNS